MGLTVISGHFPSSDFLAFSDFRHLLHFRSTSAEKRINIYKENFFNFQLLKYLIYRKFRFLKEKNLYIDHKKWQTLKAYNLILFGLGKSTIIFHKELTESLNIRYIYFY